MQLFNEWITQIILFILLGTIFELLLPNNDMKKYVNLVLGLLLLLILSKPILYLYSIDIQTILKPIDRIESLNEHTYKNTENEMNKQKKEIQATQDAYIWNEIALQLKQEANDYLSENGGQEIGDLQIEHNEDNEITAIYCTLGNVSENDFHIAPVDIDTDQPLKRNKDVDIRDKKLATKLGDIWELDADLIHFKQGGE